MLNLSISESYLNISPMTVKRKQRFIRKKINSNTICREIEIATIPFDNKTKSYEFLQERPDIGYFYILRWDR